MKMISFYIMDVLAREQGFTTKPVGKPYISSPLVMDLFGEEGMGFKSWNSMIRARILPVLRKGPSN